MKKLLLLLVSVLLFSHNLFSQVTLTAPNGGEIWLAGSTQTISWTDVNPSGFVNLDYSSDNGITWNSIVSSANSMYPNYSWWTPTIAAATYKVKVTDANNSLYFDESDTPFTITDQLPPALTLTYPNGGEIIYNGSQQNITWTSSNVGSVNLYFSPDSGLTWNSIASNIPAYMGSYPSTVYSSSTTKALVRISDALNTATFDESDGFFTIIDTTKHKITISLPNGGENWQVGSIQYLAWTNTNMTGTVNIDYSTDNGTNWLSVAANLPSMYPTYMWTIPNTPSTACKIKVYDPADQSIFDESDAPFTITTSPTGGVVAHYNFNGNALDGTGNGHDGTVNGAQLVADRFSNPNSAYSFPNPSRIAVPHSPELNFAGGKFTFTVWMKQEAGSNTFNCILGKDYTQEFGFGTWGTDGTAPTYPRLVISSHETPSNFLSPLNVGTWYHVAVTFDDATDQVQFFVNGVLTETSTNTGSMTATTTELGIGSDGKYFDQFSGALDDIRIFDHVLTSAEILAIFNDSGNQTRILKLDAPNGGEYLVAGTVDTIHWSSNYLTQVKIDYSTNYGDTWTNIVGSMPAEYPSGYAWVVPNTPSTFCKVRVTDINDPTMVDESDNVFTINSGNGIDSIMYGGKIYHTVKIGTQTWLKENLDIGTMISSTLEQADNSVIEKYCYNDDVVNCDTYGGLYQWNETMQYVTTPGTQGICPIGWHIPTLSEFQTLNTTVSNDGNALKEIGQGAGGGAGTNTSGFSGLLAGYRGIGGGFGNLSASADLLSSTELSSTGTYDMGLNYGESGVGFYQNDKLYGFSVRCLKDENLTTSIKIDFPNGHEILTSGTVDTIRWSAPSTTQVKIDYTTDNGATWMNIAGGIYSIYPAYAWTVPSTPSTFCKVRVTDNSNPDAFDESDSAFTIQLFKSGEYVPDANTVLLDHFNGVTDANILAYSPTGQPCGSEWTSVAPSYFFNPGMNELYQALTLNPPIDVIQGSATYLKYPGGQLLSQSNGTIEFWVRLSSYAKGLSFVNQGQYFGACYGWTFNLDMDSTGMLNSSAWAAFSLNSGTNKVPLGRWAHLAVTWGSTGAKMYIDGNLVGSDVNTGMPADGYSGSVLVTLGTGAGFSASIDELRISNIQRTEFHIIPQQFISVASPNGGENFVAGTVDTIRWTSSNANILNIEYSTNNGVDWISIYPAMPASAGSVPWLIPNTPSTSCKVRIADAANATIFDESDSMFTIAPQMFTDLVAYYPFTDGSLADFSANGNAASNFGAQLVADRFGIPNNAYHFNGDAYMSVPNSLSLQSPTNMVTLSGWVNNDVGSIYAIAVKSASSGLGQYRLYLTDYSVVFSSSITSDVSMPFTFEHGKWYFVAVTWDGNNINYFVNGNFIGSVPSAGTLTPDTEPLIFGMDTPGLTEFTVGTIDDIRIYNRALPAAEIRALYHEGGWDNRMVDSGLVAYYPFNNNTIDESGNGNNGTNNGAIPTFDRFNTPNSALSFDGNNNFVLVPSSTSLNVQNSITLSAWIKTDNPHIIQDLNPGSILAKHETVQTRQYDLFFYNAPHDSLHFDLVDERDNFSSDEYFFATTTPSASYHDNQWHMVLGTYDYATGFSQIYIDGALTSARYLGQINLMKSNVPLTIGCYSEQNSNFRGFYQGIIDDIRIYDRSLSQHEIMMLYYEKEYVPTLLKVTTPVGGEVYQANSPVPIEWSASNVYNFSLEYTSDNGTSWSLICDTLTAASTGFLWYPPVIESNMMRVRITDKNNPAVFDESDSNFTVTNKIMQSIPLYYFGWNMISFYIQPESSLPRDVFPSPLVLQVKTELKSYDPALPEFLNTLKSVDASQGYLVKTDSAEHSFQVKGYHFYPADGINYRAGWNLMSYYHSYGESIWYAFEPIMNSVEEIKSLTGYFNPLGSTETNTLYSLEPGEAYWLRLKNNIDGYVLPSPQTIKPKKHQTAGQKLMVDLPWKLKGYPQSTVAIFTVTSDGKPVSAGSVVAAFVNNECRAISEVKLNAEGTAFATMVINGDKEEEVSFKIFDAVKKEAFGSNLKIKTKPGTTIQGIQELPFTFVTGIEDPILPTTTTLMNAYPNPFNPETRIRYSLNKDQHVSLKIYDVLGKEVITLVDDTKNAGYYEVSFDASGLPSGIYFYRMQSGEYVSVKKLLLLK
ncbi:MAG: LamG-like jellyroll fold domain-containing protein [Ignavibacteriaceae bacterium]|jgi:uncharacterized protein (TIGR02145 family)